MNSVEQISSTVLTNILGLISKAGLTDRQFCTNMGYGIKTVDGWKRGVSKSYMKKVDEIADYFDVPVSFLFGETDAKNSLSLKKESEFNKKLGVLNDITRNFTVEELEELIHHAHLLESARRGK